MKLVIGSDKSGFALKEAVRAWMDAEGIAYTDVGTKEVENFIPFFGVAPIAAEMVSKGEADRAILFCGTGMGMSQVANKYKGVLAACVENLYSAKMCRIINDSNVLCMGGFLIAPDLGIQMVKAFLNTEHTEGFPPERQAFLKNAKEQVMALDEKLHS